MVACAPPTLDMMFVPKVFDATIRMMVRTIAATSTIMKRCRRLVLLVLNGTGLALELVPAICDAGSSVLRALL